MRKVRPLLLSLAVFLAALSPLSIFADEAPVHTFTLESALDWVLSHNRQLLGLQDKNVQFHTQLEMAESEFDLQIQPSADAGYIGGGSAGSGLAVGTSVAFAKKLSNGTRIQITPSIQKVHNRYHSNFKTIISQPLLRGWGQDYTFSNLRGAFFNLRSANRSFYNTQCQLVLRSIISMYELVKMQHSLVLNQESFERVRKFYQAACLKSKIGVCDPIDVYRAEIEMRHAEDGLKSAQDRLQDAEDNFRDLMALPADDLIHLNIPIAYAPFDISSGEAIEAALQNRVELDQANDQQVENIRLSKVAKERLWPELNMVVNYSNCGEDQVFTDSCLRRRESTWGVGFTTSTDFNPYSERAAYEQSLSAIQIAGLNVDQTIANLTFEVKRAIRHLERSDQRIELQEKQIHSSEGELRLAQLKFDRGMGNNFDLIQAEKSLRSAQFNHWNALIDRIIGEYQMRAVLGLLMEKPCL
ncbi:MAG: TolC family protein [Parachlamydiaceae bacterium]|nr:TolC family protein [Parachlamydiaceae bacterium]